MVWNRIIFINLSVENEWWFCFLVMEFSVVMVSIIFILVCILFCFRYVFVYRYIYCELVKIVRIKICGCWMVFDLRLIGNIFINYYI